MCFVSLLDYIVKGTQVALLYCICIPSVQIQQKINDVTLDKRIANKGCLPPSRDNMCHRRRLYKMGIYNCATRKPHETFPSCTLMVSSQVFRQTISMFSLYFLINVGNICEIYVQQYSMQLILFIIKQHLFVSDNIQWDSLLHILNKYNYYNTYIQSCLFPWG